MAVEALWQLGGGGYTEKEESQRDTKSNTESPEPEPVRYPVIKSNFTLIQCEHCLLSLPTEEEAQLHQSTCGKFFILILVITVFIGVNHYVTS